MGFVRPLLVKSLVTSIGSLSVRAYKLSSHLSHTLCLVFYASASSLFLQEVDVEGRVRLVMESALTARDRVGVQDFVLVENYNSGAAFIENLRRRFRENLIYVIKLFFFFFFKKAPFFHFFQNISLGVVKHI